MLGVWLPGWVKPFYRELPVATAVDLADWEFWHSVKSSAMPKDYPMSCGFTLSHTHLYRLMPGSLKPFSREPTVATAVGLADGESWHAVVLSATPKDHPMGRWELWFPSLSFTHTLTCMFVQPQYSFRHISTWMCTWYALTDCSIDMVRLFMIDILFF